MDRVQSHIAHFESHAPGGGLRVYAQQRFLIDEPPRTAAAVSSSHLSEGRPPWCFPRPLLSVCLPQAVRQATLTESAASSRSCCAAPELRVSALSVHFCAWRHHRGVGRGPRLLALRRRRAPHPHSRQWARAASRRRWSTRLLALQLASLLLRSQATQCCPPARSPSSRFLI